MNADVVTESVDPMVAPHLYVTPAFYDVVADDVRKWAEPGAALSAEDDRQVARFLAVEARLLDGARLDEWLQLFADDCLYWIPTVVGSPDPTVQLCTAFDDRRRLEDRVVRLQTGTAYSQLPPSRTTRSISNIEAWADGAEIRVRCVVVIHEWRVDELRAVPATIGYVLRRAPGGPDFSIVRKQIDLLQADIPLRNLTFIV
jgi:3-phenylpropionate/cinnamic acid dioxygenase small subunit